MDSRLLDAYNRELGYIREMAAEFAAEHPTVAAGLGLSGSGPKDPYVERLLDGFAFLAARTQLKLEARHPEFTQHLLENIYPGFLSPIPSCAIAELRPDFKETGLSAGVRVPRESILNSTAARPDQTACQFRTAHEVVLWPLSIRGVGYTVGAGALAASGLKPSHGARAALRVNMTVPDGIDLGALPIEEVTFFISCEPTLGGRLLEQVVANCVGASVRGGAGYGGFFDLGRSAVTLVGCEDDEAMLPPSRSGLQGYRLLQEYFAFPERLRFFRVAGLRKAFAGLKGREVELLISLDRVDPALENALDETSLRLYCTPIVNLFPRQLDRVHVAVTDSEMLVTANGNAPMDFEIHSLTSVRAIGSSGRVLSDVLPMHLRRHVPEDAEQQQLFYSLQRRARLRSLRQKQVGLRAKYLGSEIFISVADARQRQFTGELRQLDIEALCTNRDLPLLLSFDGKDAHFVLDSAAPVESIRCIAGPSAPCEAPAFGDTTWRVVSHLTLNYLSLVDKDPATGASTLRGLLELYAHPASAVARGQIEGVRSVRYQPVVRRVPSPGPIVYGRGIEISVAVDDAGFAGIGVVAFGAVLERFFARYASINSFTQLRLESLSRGEIKRWPARVGQRQTL